MDNETITIKNSGKCGVWQASNTNCLDKWSTAIKEHYQHLHDESDNYSVTVMTDNENEYKVKVKVMSMDNPKDKAQYTITTYKNDNSRNMMIHSANIYPWLSSEFPSLKKLADGEGYNEIKWVANWVQEVDYITANDL